MKLFIFTLFMALFTSGRSWESKAFNQTDPAHPGKCVVKSLVLSPGEKGKPDGLCLSIRCGNANGFTTTHGCGTTETAPPCTVGEPKYPNDLYPKCCEMEIICPGGDKPTVVTITG